MTDNTDDTGKGHSRPGEAPRRPYATLELKATEIGGDGGRAAQLGGPTPEDASGASSSWSGVWARAGAWVVSIAGGLVAAGAWLLRLIRNNTFLSHAAAGVAGAALTLAVAALLGLPALRQGAVPSDLAARLSALEKVQSQPAALPAAVTDKLAAADKRVAGLVSGLDEQAKAVAALKGEQARLATDAKAIEARVAATGGAPEAGERIAKLETALAALSPNMSPDGKAGSTPMAERLAARLADVERLSGESAEAKSAAARLDRGQAALKNEVTGLRIGLEALKGSIEDRIPAKLAGFERDLQAVRKTEGERVVNAQRVLLALEITNLKRALDRGDSYVRELDAARRTAAGAVDLTPLERSSATGVPTLGALTQEFRRVANAAIDAEAEQPDASVLDRLMAGARSVVRLRKARHDADDTSAEATLGRMEAALKDGNIGETLAQGQRLPPKAAAAAGSWLRQLEARYAADKAVAEIETALKASLTGERLPAEPVPEPKR